MRIGGSSGEFLFFRWNLGRFGITVKFADSVLRECRPCAVWNEYAYVYLFCISMNKHTRHLYKLSTIGSEKTNRTSFSKRRCE